MFVKIKYQWNIRDAPNARCDLLIVVFSFYVLQKYSDTRNKSLFTDLPINLSISSYIRTPPITFVCIKLYTTKLHRCTQVTMRIPDDKLFHYLESANCSYITDAANV